MERLKNSWHEFTMGIMNSDLIKFGVDILNTFMEIINKATNKIDGLGGSIAKVSTVLAVFQMGSKIFKKLVPVIDSTMLSIVKKFHGYGEIAAAEFAKGQQSQEEKIKPQED
jgi:chorismate synthase